MEWYSKGTTGLLQWHFILPVTVPFHSTTDLTRTGLGSNLDLGGERLAISTPVPQHGLCRLKNM